MIFEPFPEFLPSEYRVKFATERWEHREAKALRRLVFCNEQKIFAGDDRDDIDDIATRSSPSHPLRSLRRKSSALFAFARGLLSLRAIAGSRRSARR